MMAMRPDVVHDEGLAIAAVVRARCAVPHMPDAHVPIRNNLMTSCVKTLYKPDVTVCKRPSSHTTMPQLSCPRCCRAKARNIRAMRCLSDRN